MRIIEQQLIDLDSFDWFADGIDSIWGEEAYDAITSIERHRAFGIEEWTGYVHYMFLTRPYMAPTENFCRRVALWYRDGKKVSVEEAEAATADELLPAYFLGVLPRIDSLQVTKPQAKKIVNWLGAGRERTGGDHDGLAYFDAWFNHPSATSEDIEKIATRYLRRGQMDAEFILAANASPLIPKTVKEGLSRTAAKSVKRALRMSGNDGFRWRFLFSYLSAVYNLPENRRQIKGRIRRQFKKYHEGRFDLSGYYEDKDLWRTKLLFEVTDDKNLEFEWWEAVTHLFPLRKNGVKETAMAFGVGMDGVPPGFTIQIASSMLASVSQQKPVATGRNSLSELLWVLPYLAGARRWIVEQSGLDADNVPFEWVAELMGVEANIMFEDSKMLSPAWIQAQEVRRGG